MDKQEISSRPKNHDRTAIPYSSPKPLTISATLRPLTLGAVDNPARELMLCVVFAQTHVTGINLIVLPSAGRSLIVKAAALSVALTEVHVPEPEI
jgi:hypothetical protein